MSGDVCRRRVPCLVPSAGGGCRVVCGLLQSGAVSAAVCCHVVCRLQPCRVPSAAVSGAVSVCDVISYSFEDIAYLIGGITSGA